MIVTDPEKIEERSMQIIESELTADIPEENKEAASIIRVLLDKYNLQTASVDLETDLLNSPLHKT